MKNFVFAMMAACSIFGASAQDLQGISLNAPSKQCGTDVMTAFANRQSCRSYADKELSLNQLVPVTSEDLRKDVAKGQDFAAVAPVSLVLVSDLSKMRGGDTPQNRLTGAMDAGIVSQNISIACAGMGLATVPRGTMDKEVLAQKLKLKATQVPFLNHPVGFAE